MTEVIFRKDKNPYTKEWEVTAVFRQIDTSDGDLLCYAHIGQHSHCSLDWYQSTKPASEEEYKPLYDELKNLVGYDDLVVKHRLNYSKIH